MGWEAWDALEGGLHCVVQCWDETEKPVSKMKFESRRMTDRWMNLGDMSDELRNYFGRVRIQTHPSTYFCIFFSFSFLLI